MNNLTVFHGVDHKVGTTMISQSVAELIAECRPELTVLWISLQGREGTEYIQEVGESIEGLKLYLDSKVFTADEVLKKCGNGKNLYLLGGVSAITEERYYFPHTAAYLLSQVEHTFDVIIADSGNNVDNGLSVGALELGGDNFLVLTQQESMIKRYEKLRRFYRELHLRFDRFAVNQYRADDPYDLDYIEKRLELDEEQIFKVQECGQGRRAEMEHQTLVAYRNEKYLADLRLISNEILKRQELPSIERQRKSRWKDFM